jgi:isopenicillin-N epimerase
MHRTRREFFDWARGAAAAAATWPALLQALQAAPGKPDPANEDYWLLVKRQFPLRDGLIYMNAANVCPASRAVMDRHLEYLRDFHADPSFQNREKYDPLAERARGKMAALLGAKPDEIAFTRNTSEGTNIIVQGVDLKPGDEVIITDHNHPSNNDSWKVRARRAGFTVRSLPVPVPAAGGAALLDAFRAAITPRTKVIAVTHVTSTVGLTYPVREIAALAKGRDLWVHVDGAQSFGALDVNLGDIGCDSYSGSLHKWPMGPLEAGVLYVRSDRIAGLWPSIVTAGWSDRIAGARKFEVFGQRDNPRLVAVEAAVDFLNLIGMKHVEARLRALNAALQRGLREIPGVRVKTNAEPELNAGVVKFEIDRIAPRAAYDALWKRHSVGMAQTASGDSRGLRLSPHIYNSMEEVSRVVAAVGDVARG